MLPKGLKDRVLWAAYQDELFRIPHRQRLQDDRIEQAEDGRRRPDPERQRQRGGGGETWRFAQAAKRIPDVLPHTFDGRFPADVTHAVLHRLRAAKLQPGGTRGCFGRHPGADVLVDDVLEEVVQLGVELLFHGTPLQQTSQSADDPCDPGHYRSPSDARRILAMAVVWTSQSRVSA